MEDARIFYRETAKGTDRGSSIHFRAFWRSYALGFLLLRVTGFSGPQVFRSMASRLRFSFLESFS